MSFADLRNVINLTSEEDDCYDLEYKDYEGTDDDNVDEGFTNCLRKYFYNVYLFYAKQLRIKNDLFGFLLNRGEAITSVGEEIKCIINKMHRVAEICQHVIVFAFTGALHCLELDVRQIDMDNNFVCPISKVELDEAIELNCYCAYHVKAFCICKDYIYI